jgi:hypothetical protein
LIFFERKSIKEKEIRSELWKERISFFVAAKHAIKQSGGLICVKGLVFLQVDESNLKNLSFGL